MSTTNKFKTFFLIAALAISIVGVLVAWTGNTAPGTGVITSGGDAGTVGTADTAGDIVAQYSNAMVDTAALTTNVVTTVALDVPSVYDMLVDFADAEDTTNVIGAVITNTFGFTNYANTTADITVDVIFQAGDTGWQAAQAQYKILDGTDSVLASDVGGTATYTYSVAAGSSITFKVTTEIPATVAGMGETNAYKVVVRNPVGTALNTGDAWPGTHAVEPATDDTANARDWQEVNMVTTAAAPILIVSQVVEDESASALTTGDSVSPYEYITTKIYYSNVGFAAASDVSITYALPANTLLSASGTAENNNAYHTGEVGTAITYYNTSSTLWDGDDNTAAGRTNISKVKWAFGMNVAADDNTDGSGPDEGRVQTTLIIK